MLQIHTRCDDKFIEVSPDEKENAELFVEDMASHVLLDLFGEVSIDDVTIKFSSERSNRCAIFISAHCPCQSPRSREYMKSEVKHNIASILRELFVTVQVDNVVLGPSQRGCKCEAALL
jgi:hypothetical protein